MSSCPVCLEIKTNSKFHWIKHAKPKLNAIHEIEKQFLWMNFKDARPIWDNLLRNELHFRKKIWNDILMWSNGFGIRHYIDINPMISHKLFEYICNLLKSIYQLSWVIKTSIICRPMCLCFLWNVTIPDTHVLRCCETNLTHDWWTESQLCSWPNYTKI